MPNAEYGTSKKIVKKDIKYIGRDFSSIRQNLIILLHTMILMNHHQV